MRVPENLKLFSILSTMYSFFFFFIMYGHLRAACWPTVTLVSLVYVGLLAYSAGKLAATTDSKSLKTNKMFTFHLAAYLTVNIVHALFFVFNWVSAGATLVSVLATALIWGAALMLHGYVVGRRSSKSR